MAGFLVKRLLALAGTLLVVSILTYTLVIVTPGDPIRENLFRHATPDTYKAIAHEYGLDLPFWQRYLTYMGGLLHGDLGLSLSQPGQRVNDLLADGLPISLQLGGLSLLVGLLVGVPLGVVAAARHNGPVADHLSMGVMLLLYAAPSFVLIPPLIDILCIHLGWLPTGHWGDPGWLGIKEAILPVLVNATGVAGYFARSLRSFLLEVLGQDYIRIARAKGLTRRRILFTHALKNTLVPFVSLLGPTLAFLVVGSFVVETLFSINGIGNITVQATLQGDLAVTEATTLILALAVVSANALTDIFYTIADPRVHL